MKPAPPVTMIFIGESRVRSSRMLLFETWGAHGQREQSDVPGRALAGSWRSFGDQFPVKSGGFAIDRQRDGVARPGIVSSFTSSGSRSVVVEDEGSHFPLWRQTTVAETGS